MNLTAWYWAHKPVCLEDIEGGKFDVVCASAASATDKRFLVTEEHYWVAVKWLVGRIQLKHEQALQADCQSM